MGFWLVGDAPHTPAIGNPELAMTPDDSGVPYTPNRLLEVTTWTIDVFCRVFTTRTTVWDHPQRIWMPRGRERAATIGLKSRADGSLGVVLVGAETAKAFNLADETPFEWIGRYAVVPHPTGKCRQWNPPDPSARASIRERARAFFEDLRCAVFPPAESQRPTSD